MATGFLIHPLRISYYSRRFLQITAASVWGEHHAGGHNAAAHPKSIWLQETSGFRKRFFSQDLSQLEKEYSKAYAVRCRRIFSKIRKKLEAVYKIYTFSSSGTKIHLGEHVYFEENGCIYRYRNGCNRVLEMLLNVEELGFQDVSVQRIRLSPNQLYLAASIKHSDLEECTCVVVKLAEIPEVCSVISKVFSFEWANDAILFFVRQENLQCHKVFQLVFKAGRHYTHLIYKEQDPRFFVEVSCTKNKRFLTINCNSKSTSEVWLINCHQPFDLPQLVQQRTPGAIYHVEHRNKELYIVTTYGDKISYKLMKTAVDCCSIENWQLIYSLDANSKLIDMEQFQSHSVLLWKNWGHLYLTAIPLESPAAVKLVKLPSWACTFESEPNPNFSASSFSFQLSSPVHPATRFVYSLQENEICELKEEITAFKSWDYCTVHLRATSMDGTLVPITVFHKTLPKEMLSETPLLVHMYGAYGMDLNMSFKPENMLLLEENWILAYCHVRGGGELGLIWHEDGKLDKKHNGLNDLIACITQLHNWGYSNPSLTALTANSAGGVLAGALCNSAPHIVKAVVMKAPFLDVLNVMLDPSLPLTIEEREEWGDPLADRMFLEYIRSYCPYQNIKCQEYPSMFITSYEKDQRVPKEGLLKYISKLRKARVHRADSINKQEGCSSNIILDMQPEGDHFGPTDWDDCLNEVARHLAFLYKELGIDDKILKKKKKL